MEKEKAKKIANEFSSNYRTQRNPEGWEHIVIYGGSFADRDKFSWLIGQFLSFPASQAYIIEQEEKLGFRERNEDLRAFYVNLDDKFNTSD